MTLPTIGRIVHYRMSDDDVARSRHDLSRNPPQVLGQFNLPDAGDVYPAMVTSVTDHPDHPDVNLRVFLDGPFDFFGPSRVQGDVPGTWSWPERV